MSIFSDSLSISPAGVFLLLAAGWVGRRMWGWLLLSFIRAFPEHHQTFITKLRSKADDEEALLHKLKARR